MLIFESVLLNELYKVSSEILAQYPEAKIFLLSGELGAGKTTLTKSFCSLLNCKDGITSPTYSIVNEYKTTSNTRIFHIDLYRLKSEKEVLDAGIEEIFFNQDYCFVEWFEVAKNLLPENCVLIELFKIDAERRRIIAKQF